MLYNRLLHHPSRADEETLLRITITVDEEQAAGRNRLKDDWGKKKKREALSFRVW